MDERFDLENLITEFIVGGNKLLSLGQYETLRDLCVEFLHKCNDDRVYSLISCASSALGDFQNAEKYARQGFWLNPVNADHMFNLAVALNCQNRFSNAWRCYNRATQFGDAAISEVCEKYKRAIESALSKNSIELSPPKQRRRVLIISVNFYSHNGYNVRRTIKIVKYLRTFGWEPVVITLTCDNKTAINEFTLYDDLPENLEMIRIPSPQNISVSMLNTVKKRLLFMLSSPICNKLESIYSKLDVYGRINLLSFPDNMVYWANYVADTIDKQIDMDEINLMYSMSDSYSNHFAGYIIKERFGKPLVVDLDDNWIKPEVNIDNLLNAIRVGSWKSIFDFADKAICVTERGYENVMNSLCTKSKLSYITSGYDEEDFEGIEVSGSFNDKFTMVHIGTPHTEQMMNILVSALRNLIKQGKIDGGRTAFYGCNTSRVAFGYNKKITGSDGLDCVDFIKKNVSDHEGLDLLARADLIILLPNSEGTDGAAYPEHFFECLRTGNNILNLGPEGNSAEKLLYRMRFGTNARLEDLDTIKSTILRNYNTWLNNHEAKPFKPSFSFREFEYRHLAERYARIFDQMFEKSISAVISEKDITYEFMSGRYISVCRHIVHWLSEGKELSDRTLAYYAQSLNFLGRFDEAVKSHNIAQAMRNSSE